MLYITNTNNDLMLVLEYSISSSHMEWSNGFYFFPKYTNKIETK